MQWKKIGQERHRRLTPVWHIIFRFVERRTLGRRTVRGTTRRRKRTMLAMTQDIVQFIPELLQETVVPVYWSVMVVEFGLVTLKVYIFGDGGIDISSILIFIMGCDFLGILGLIFCLGTAILLMSELRRKSPNAVRNGGHIPRRREAALVDIMLLLLKLKGIGNRFLGQGRQDLLVRYDKGRSQRGRQEERELHRTP